MKVDESGWKLMKLDKSGWNGWKLMKVDESGWKYTSDIYFHLVWMCTCQLIVLVRIQHKNYITSAHPIVQTYKVTWYKVTWYMVVYQISARFIMNFLHSIVWSGRVELISDVVLFCREAPSTPFLFLPCLGVDFQVWWTYHCVWISSQFSEQTWGPIFASLSQGVQGSVCEQILSDPLSCQRKLQ